MLQPNAKTIRGEFQHIDRAKQLIKFSDMRWGSITPTDIDMVIDFQNNMWVIAEIKHIGTPLKRGQELALERLAIDLSKCEKPVFCVVADHKTEAPRDIYAKNTIVRKYYYNPGNGWRWIKPQIRINLKTAIDRYIQHENNKEKSA